MSPLEAHFFMYTQDRIIFEQRKHEYEVMRLQTFHINRAHQDFKKGHIRKPSDLIPMPWDNDLPEFEINPENYTEDAFAALDVMLGLN